jgi:hypothetical protein
VETPEGQACFEKWITEAMGLLNNYKGNYDFNYKKPYSINKYGVLESRSFHSVARPTTSPATTTTATGGCGTTTTTAAGSPRAGRVEGRGRAVTARVHHQMRRTHGGGGGGGGGGGTGRSHPDGGGTGPGATTGGMGGSSGGGGGVRLAAALAGALSISPATGATTTARQYTVRQIGNKVYWSMDDRPHVLNVFQGTVEGNTLTGEWVDLPAESSTPGKETQAPHRFQRPSLRSWRTIRSTAPARGIAARLAQK